MHTVGAETHKQGAASHKCQEGGQDPTKATDPEGNPPGASPRSGSKPNSQEKLHSGKRRITVRNKRKQMRPRLQASTTKQPDSKGEEAGKTVRQRKMQAKRDLKCEDNGTKQSQQPGKPPPERRPQKESANHRKLREVAELSNALG